MMKKLLGACLALAAPFAAADATIVTINFESQRGSPSGEVFGSFAYDTTMLPTSTPNIPGVGNIGRYSVGTATFTVLGRTYTNALTIDVVDAVGSPSDALYAYMPYTADTNINFIIEFPTTEFSSTALPDNVSNGSSIVALISPIFGFQYAATATYTATYSNAAVPEPAAWALMISGFGLVGGAMRRRKVSTTVSFA